MGFLLHDVTATAGQSHYLSEDLTSMVISFQGLQMFSRKRSIVRNPPIQSKIQIQIKTAADQ